MNIWNLLYYFIRTDDKSSVGQSISTQSSYKVYVISKKKMESNKIHRIDHHHFREILNKYMNNHNNNVNGEKVSDDNFLKYSVYEENSDYKKSIIIASAVDADNLNTQNLRKLEIYRDRFSNGHKMVFSQKVHCSEYI